MSSLSNRGRSLLRHTTDTARVNVILPRNQDTTRYARSRVQIELPRESHVSDGQCVILLQATPSS